MSVSLSNTVSIQTIKIKRQTQYLKEVVVLLFLSWRVNIMLLLRTGHVMPLEQQPPAEDTLKM